jgi:adenylosuccinate synthase
MGKLTCIVGGQYGSEGKGHVTAQLTNDRDAVVRVAGPNAGHSAYDRRGRLWKLRQIPVGAVWSTGPVVLAAGSEIDLEVLEQELTELDDAGYSISTRIHIDPQSTVIDDVHKASELGLVKAVGSTGKGIGAARADRLMRTATIFEQLGIDQSDSTSELLTGWLIKGGNVIVEGTQGYGLGLHAGHYPQCTSSDCRAIDMLAMAGISPWHPAVTEFEVVVVARAFPIRVAGNSGPMKGETSWEDLGLPKEHTTVTGKVRRVGEWDPDLVKQAVEANGGANCVVALTMVDQKFPQVAKATNARQISPEVMQFVRQVEEECGTRVGFLGTSPTTLVRLP